MKKALCVVLILLFSCSFLFAQNDNPIITVLDFKTDGISQSEMSSIISLLSSSLFKTDVFTVIDVSQRETVLSELEFSMSGCSDDSCMLEVGKLLSAEGIVVGSLGKVGSKYVLSTKLLETETARTLSTADGVYADLDALIDDVDTIAAELGAPYGAVAVVKPVTEPIEAKSEPPTEAAANAEPQSGAGEVNIPAIATLSAGVISAGVGTYFLVTSLPLIFDYLDAKEAYEGETDAALVADRYDTYNTAWTTANEANAETNMIIGASLTGVGLVLSTISIIMFASDGGNSADSPQVAFVPGPNAATLSFRMSY